MKVSIIGLGLIGGSIGLALRRSQGSRIDLVGYARSPAVAVEAVRRGAVDRADPDLPTAVAGSDMVIICTPVRAVEDVLRVVSKHVSQDCLITDTASTKHQVMLWAEQYLAPRLPFVGGHPMAGKETSGIEAAEAGLFGGCTYCLTPAPWTGPDRVRMAEALVAWVGARPHYIDALRHDFLVAAVSHLPVLVSAALVASTSASPDWPDMARLASTGFRDATRLASGRPELNMDIFATNRSALVQWVDEFSQALGRFRDLVASDDETLRTALAQAREARERWVRDRLAQQKCGTQSSA